MGERVPTRALVVPWFAPPPGLAGTERVLRPARPELVTGEVHGAPCVQCDLTPERYDSLAEFTVTLLRVFPRLVSAVRGERAAP